MRAGFLWLFGLVAFVLMHVSPHARAWQGEAPSTKAEASGYRKTSTSGEVASYLQALHAASARTWLGSIGTSNEGKDLPLLVVADPPVRRAEEARASGRLVVLLFGNIHAGEVAGKEALLALARDLALGDRSALLDDLVVCFVPNYNPDGNDRMAADNRPGQVGPDEMGQRENAQGLDLNRDWIKMEAPETRALVRFMREWDPAVVVDTHTTNGSHHRYVITYAGPKHPASDPRLVGFVRDRFLPEVDQRFEAQSEYDAFWYGNFEQGHTQWTTYPAWPRYGGSYRGLSNRISVLCEAYSYASYEDRVKGSLAFCRAVLEEAVAQRQDIERVVRESRRYQASDEDRSVVLRERVVGFEGKVEALGYQEYDAAGERIGVTVEPRTYEVQLINDFEPTLTVRRPWAYLIPAEFDGVARHLQRHGVEVREVREHMELDAGVYQLDVVQQAGRAFQGHHMLDIAKVTLVTRGVRAQPGWFLVKGAQDLGNLAAYMLEPQATDSLASWNFFEGHLAEGGEYPIVRVEGPAPILTRSARALEDERGARKRITAEMVIENRGAPRLSGEPGARRDWLDDEHLAKTVPGVDGRYRVSATTGRVQGEVHEHDWEKAAAAIARLPTIGADRARQLARSGFAGGREGPLVFEHGNDLYYVSADGAEAARLTSTPAREESWQVSPDGAFVAYVSDNDLWVVDLASRTPRALTTGGSDLLRQGKAGWLYYEELFGRNWRAFWWSPNSRDIAFLITDSSAVPEYTIVGLQRHDPVVEVERYARPGEPNPSVELAFASVEGGGVRRADLSMYDHGQFLVSHVSWTPDGRQCVAHVQDRIQTWLDVLHVSPNGGEPKRLLRETTGAWVQSPGDFWYLKDGSFLMLSERDGFKHLYHHARDGKLLRPVTRGEWECRSVVRVDEEGGWIYYTGTAASPIGNDFYKVRLEGGEPTRLTHEPGAHSVSLNPAGTMFIDSWSGVNTPGRVALRSAGDGSLIRWLDTNPVYELEDYELARLEAVRIPSRREGVDLEAIVHYPPDFDATRAYPMWVMTYAGPASPTVRDSWQGARMWEQLHAAAGVVVLRVDPYAASGKGARSAWTSYLNMGVGELQDLEDAVAWAVDQGWADARRVGISGHSFGGYITAYALTHSTTFSAGIAGAPVTDWRHYDTIYTERYMSTPQANPDGYRRTSAIEGAANLQGRLLIAHGEIDDNVHPQNTMLLVAALQRANKLFEMAIYPGHRHGLGSTQYRRLQWDFVKRTMGVEDPRDESQGAGMGPRPVETASRGTPPSR